MIMGVIITGIISFTHKSNNIGFISNFFRIWFKSWIIAYGVAIPLVLIVAPKVQLLVDGLLKNKQ